MLRCVAPDLFVRLTAHRRSVSRHALLSLTTSSVIEVSSTAPPGRATNLKAEPGRMAPIRPRFRIFWNRDLSTRRPSGAFDLPAPRVAAAPEEQLLWQ